MLGELCFILRGLWTLDSVGFEEVGACFKFHFKFHVPRGPCRLAHDTMQEAAAGTRSTLNSQSLPCRGQSSSPITECGISIPGAILCNRYIDRVQDGIWRNWKELGIS